MEDTLKRLLEAERQAEQRVEEAKGERERMTRTALEEAHAAEQRFIARVPEIQDAFLEKSRTRAGQSVAELQRRYAERNRELRRMAEEHEADAIEAALAMLLETEG